ncbi:hypothetical protein GGI35DRAFT_472902 [Trichoderma velutinum]
MTATVADIMKKLSVTDALSLRNSMPNSKILDDCLDQRVDPVSYFQQTFDYPVTLMAAMFDSGCILSGSRALEYFFPGSIGPESDWDFYVPAYKESVVDMVNALQICGVSWNTDASNIASDLFSHGKATITRVMLESLVTWVTGLGEGTAMSILGNELYEIARAYSRQTELDLKDVSTLEMVLDSEKNIHFVPILRVWPREDDKTPYQDLFGRPFSILNGTIATSRGSEKVQLIICSRYKEIKSCMSFIGDFYASHVQCFIRGWCAGHLYYNQTSTKKATVWRHLKNDSSILKAIRKYKTRGFELIDRKGSNAVIRTLTDDDAYLGVYGSMYRKYIPKYCYSILNDWLDKREQNIESLSWLENDGRILGCSSLVERFHRESNVTFAGSGRELPMSARRRLGNMIAVHLNGPDELRSAAYRSAVGRNVMEHGWEMQIVARSGTASFFFKDVTPWSWAL